MELLTEVVGVNGRAAIGAEGNTRTQNELAENVGAMNLALIGA